MHAVTGRLRVLQVVLSEGGEAVLLLGEKLPDEEAYDPGYPRPIPTGPPPPLVTCTTSVAEAKAVLALWEAGEPAWYELRPATSLQLQ